MTGLERWKEDEKKRIEEADIRVASNSIWYRIDKCKYCKYHVNKMCIKDRACVEGIIGYLESEGR